MVAHWAFEGLKIGPIFKIGPISAGANDSANFENLSNLDSSYWIASHFDIPKSIPLFTLYIASFLANVFLSLIAYPTFTLKSQNGVKYL